MLGVRYFAIAAGVMLLLSGVLANANAAMRPTALTLSVDPMVINHGGTVTFSGMLTNADTGEGIAGKTVRIHMEAGMGPAPIASGMTNADGAYTIIWQANLERNRDTPITVLAQFDGDGTAMPSRTAKITYKIALIPVNLEITTDTDKNRARVGDRVMFNVAIYDGNGNFLDPEVIKSTYQGNFVQMMKVDVGRYTFETPRLTKFDNQFGVFIETLGYVSAQKSLTVTAFGAHTLKPMKTTASKVGDNITVRVTSSVLNPSDIYTFRGQLINATPVEGSATNWQFSVENPIGTFVFKSLSGALKPGGTKVFKVKADGTPEKLFWEVRDLNGKVVASGVTVVKALRSK